METSLKIDKAAAVRLYPTASPELKEIFKKTFGDNAFSENIMDRVKSFEDACVVAGANPHDDRFTSGPCDTIAYEKLKVITCALNEGEKLKYGPGTPKKWSPWFEHDGSGFRFLGSDYVITHSYTSGGSRLCYKSKELSDYAGKQFIDLYNQFLN